jgi:hypothetical protein
MGAFGDAAGRSRACARGGLVARIGRLVGPFWPSLVSGARCRSSVVEHSIGNGEVDSSILSGSTIHLIEIIVVYTDDFLKSAFYFFKGTTA